MENGSWARCTWGLEAWERVKPALPCPALPLGLHTPLTSCLLQFLLMPLPSPETFPCLTTSILGPRTSPPRLSCPQMSLNLGSFLPLALRGGPRHTEKGFLGP